jgi:hypothetical protein
LRKLPMQAPSRAINARASGDRGVAGNGNGSRAQLR